MNYEGGDHETADQGCVWLWAAGLGPINLYCQYLAWCRCSQRHPSALALWNSLSFWLSLGSVRQLIPTKHVRHRIQWTLWLMSACMRLWLAHCVTAFCMVCKAIHSLAPWYLNELRIPVSTVPNLSVLRSAARGDLVVPRTRLQLGNCAFCVAGPVARNSLPLDIRSAQYIFIFRKHAQDAYFLTLLLHRLHVSRVRAANIVRRPCSNCRHVTAPYKWSFRRTGHV